jgi:hypothetical protein
MCRNSLMLGTSKNVRIRRVPDVAVWFWTDCDEEHATAYRQSVEMSTLVGRAMPSFFIRAWRGVRSNPDCAPVRPLMVQLVSLEMEKQRAGI